MILYNIKAGYMQKLNYLASPGSKSCRVESNLSTNPRRQVFSRRSPYNVRSLLYGDVIYYLYIYHCESFKKVSVYFKVVAIKYFCLFPVADCFYWKS